MNDTVISIHEVTVQPELLSPGQTGASDTIFLINFRNHRDMYPPFGIMYVADALMQLGFKVRLFHETEDALEDFVAQVAAERPLFFICCKSIYEHPLVLPQFKHL